MGFHPVYGHYGAGEVLWSIISTALFVGLLVAAIMLLVRVFSGPRQPGVGLAGRPVPRAPNGYWRSATRGARYPRRNIRAGWRSSGERHRDGRRHRRRRLGAEGADEITMARHMSQIGNRKKVRTPERPIAERVQLTPMRTPTPTPTASG